MENHEGKIAIVFDWLVGVFWIDSVNYVVEYADDEAMHKSLNDQIVEILNQRDYNIHQDLWKNWEY